MATGGALASCRPRWRLPAAPGCGVPRARRLRVAPPAPCRESTSPLSRAPLPMALKRTPPPTARARVSACPEHPPRDGGVPRTHRRTRYGDARHSSGRAPLPYSIARTWCGSPKNRLRPLRVATDDCHRRAAANRCTAWRGYGEESKDFFVQPRRTCARRLSLKLQTPGGHELAPVQQTRHTTELASKRFASRIPTSRWKQEHTIRTTNNRFTTVGRKTEESTTRHRGHRVTTHQTNVLRSGGGGAPRLRSAASASSSSSTCTSWACHRLLFFAARVVSARRLLRMAASSPMRRTTVAARRSRSAPLRRSAAAATAARAVTSGDGSGRPHAAPTGAATGGDPCRRAASLPRPRRPPRPPPATRGGAARRAPSSRSASGGEPPRRGGGVTSRRSASARPAPAPSASARSASARSASARPAPARRSSKRRASTGAAPRPRTASYAGRWGLTEGLPATALAVGAARSWPCRAGWGPAAAAAPPACEPPRRSTDGGSGSGSGSCSGAPPSTALAAGGPPRGWAGQSGPPGRELQAKGASLATPAGQSRSAAVAAAADRWSPREVPRRANPPAHGPLGGRPPAAPAAARATAKRRSFSSRSAAAARGEGPTWRATGAGAPSALAAPPPPPAAAAVDGGRAAGARAGDPAGNWAGVATMGRVMGESAAAPAAAVGHGKSDGSGDRDGACSRGEGGAFLRLNKNMTARHAGLDDDSAIDATAAEANTAGRSTAGGVTVFIGETRAPPPPLIEMEPMKTLHPSHERRKRDGGVQVKTTTMVRLLVSIDTCLEAWTTKRGTPGRPRPETARQCSPPSPCSDAGSASGAPSPPPPPPTRAAPTRACPMWRRRHPRRPLPPSPAVGRRRRRGGGRVGGLGLCVGALPDDLLVDLPQRRQLLPRVADEKGVGRRRRVAAPVAVAAPNARDGGHVHGGRVDPIGAVKGLVARGAAAAQAGRRRGGSGGGRRQRGGGPAAVAAPARVVVSGGGGFAVAGGRATAPWEAGGGVGAGGGGATARAPAEAGGARQRAGGGGDKGHARGRGAGLPQRQECELHSGHETKRQGDTTLYNHKASPAKAWDPRSPPPPSKTTTPPTSAHHSTRFKTAPQSRSAPPPPHLLQRWDGRVAQRQHPLQRLPLVGPKRVDRAAAGDQHGAPVVGFHLQHVAAKGRHLRLAQRHHQPRAARRQAVEHRRPLRRVGNGVGGDDRPAGADRHHDVGVVDGPPTRVRGAKRDHVVAEEAPPRRCQPPVRALRQRRVGDTVHPVEHQASGAFEEARVVRRLIPRQVNDVRVAAEAFEAREQLGPPLPPPVGRPHRVKDERARAVGRVGGHRVGGKVVVGVHRVGGAVERLVGEEVHARADAAGAAGGEEGVEGREFVQDDALQRVGAEGDRPAAAAVPIPRRPRHEKVVRGRQRIVLKGGRRDHEQVVAALLEGDLGDGRERVGVVGRQHPKAVGVQVLPQGHVVRRQVIAAHQGRGGRRGGSPPWCRPRPCRVLIDKPPRRGVMQRGAHHPRHVIREHSEGGAQDGPRRVAVKHVPDDRHPPVARKDAAGHGRAEAHPRRPQADADEDQVWARHDHVRRVHHRVRRQLDAAEGGRNGRLGRRPRRGARRAAGEGDVGSVVAAAAAADTARLGRGDTGRPPGALRAGVVRPAGSGRLRDPPEASGADAQHGDGRYGARKRQPGPRRTRASACPTTVGDSGGGRGAEEEGKGRHNTVRHHRYCVSHKNWIRNIRFSIMNRPLSQ
ncbi:hypothetical protein BU14_0031s0094 [Porphyra umbilicalis]|uniref:Uncharacterized protein n=1 Tax=Porphyra umbilicalis TaxID=2786 RepID=A0A1X6PJ57_PORUM|nr:hypothetical protein BU14_0031s0094 [Porphyra umbilicalis]|eukprot:OSX80924.1 hypothetical protein BU14_0031s0094 [Porphyra umbilicalis]